jgi:hypothetical protein
MSQIHDDVIQMQGTVPAASHQAANAWGHDEHVITAAPHELNKGFIGRSEVDNAVQEGLPRFLRESSALGIATTT